MPDADISARVPLHVVVGMPRAATTWLVRHLNSHPDVVAFGESQFFGNRWIAPGDDGRYDETRLRAALDELAANPLNSTVPTRLGATEGREAGHGWMTTVDREQIGSVVAAAGTTLTAPVRPGDVIGAVAAEFARREGATVAVEKTPHHLRHVDRIAAEVPGAQILVLIRGPEPFLLSYKHQADRKGSDHDWQRRQYHPIGVGLLWRSYARQAQAAAKDLPDQAWLVRTDDIADDPQAVLDEVWQRLGVSRREVEVEGRTNSSFGADRPVATSTERFWLWVICRGAAADTGYDLAFTRPDIGGMAASLLGLLPWAWWNLKHVRSRITGPLLPYIRRAVTGGR